MRFFLAIVGALLAAQCATPEDERFRVGESPRAFVIIGVAESGANTSPRYTMLWRRIDASGAFTRYDDDNNFELETHSSESVRVRGIPGEFFMAELEPGVYALDSVFAILRGERLNYSANGVIVGPERPTFEVRPGEAIYLGIWEMNLEEVTAVARPWRLEGEDVRAAMRQSDPIIGEVRVRATYTSAVPCTPHQLYLRSQRQVC
jgi:hypothetical protein